MKMRRPATDTSHLFGLEVLTVARPLGLGIATLAITDWVDVAGGTIEDAPLRGSLRMLQDLSRIQRKHVIGRYRAAQRAPSVVAARAWSQPEEVVQDSLASRTG